MAAGVSGVYAPLSSSFCACSSRLEDRKSTIVQPCWAILAIFSPSGTGVRPSMRVMMTDCEMAGSVYSASSAAAAPENDETPGVTSWEMPSASSRSICSRIAPNSDGSPVCRRTVVLPSRSIWRIFAMTSSSVMEAESWISQPSLA